MAIKKVKSKTEGKSVVRSLHTLILNEPHF